MLTVVLLLLGSVSFVTVRSFECPPAEDVTPCVCARDTVFCHNNLTTTKDLEQVMKSLNGKYGFNLNFKNLNLGNFSLPMIKNLGMHSFEIMDCKLESIVDSNNKNLSLLADTLYELKIINSVKDSKGNFRMNIFSLKSLRGIEMTDNVIKQVRSDLFALTPNTVSRLNLEKNRIERVAAGAFARLTSLQTLNLDNNNIQTLTRSILPTAAFRLDMLTFQSNSITSLPEDFFSNLHYLKSIDISENKMTELPENTWHSVWSQLRFLNAYKNPLICDSRIEWMFTKRGPKLMSAFCESPAERRYKSLDTLIEENRPLSMKEKLAKENVMYFLLSSNYQNKS